ncbi:tripartite tricarboxylate transporter TctB family protein [Geodermatophilus ruber]|uniref:tripartite tricarboxylate transporter TctB family protein n=1 Tax=Geodermatophilus ruber TaxID=504800 RepID=UPI0015A53D3D|nr:tripartite tricarboxylate transporter TctB family protein [Geodermatophilus ruber]
MVRLWIGPTTLGAIGVVGLIGAIHLGVGTTSVPGAGMWPAVASTLIIVSALVMGPQPDTEAVHRTDAVRVGGALSLLALFITLFTYTGIFIPALVVLALWLRFLAGRGLVFSLLTAVGTAGGLHLLFGVFFGVGG